MASTEDATKSIVTLQADLKGIENGVTEFTKVKNKLIGTVHTMTIKGHPYIKKSGWRIVALGFNISDRIVSKEIKDLKDSEYIVTYTVEATAPNGRSVQAIGSCSTLEKDKSGARKYHDTETQAHTRAKNRAIADLVGLGEVTAEEMSSNGTDGDNTQVEFCNCEIRKQEPPKKWDGMKLDGTCTTCHKIVKRD